MVTEAKTNESSFLSELQFLASKIKLFVAINGKDMNSGIRFKIRQSLRFALCTPFNDACSRLRLKCDGTRAETRFRLSAKRTSPFKSAGASVRSTTGNRGVRISGSNAGYITFRGNVKSTGYPLHSPVFPLFPLPYVTVCHHISTGL